MSTTEGESESSAHEAAPLTLAEVLSKGAEPIFRLHPIAGFWRRFLAFLVDCIVLGVVGQVLAWSIPSMLFEIGPYGRIGGQAIALLYLGLMNSWVGGGQTLGKRVLSAAVRDAEGKPIGIGRSIVRSSIWIVPGVLNGWSIPLMSNPVVAFVAVLVVFGIGGAVIATMVFNRQTRQGLHDMLTHTYVLRLDGEPVEALPATPRGQWVLSGVIFSVALTLVTMGIFFRPLLEAKLQPVSGLQRTLMTDRRFFTVGVTDSTVFVEHKKNRVLQIKIWCKGEPSEPTQTAMMNDIARTALTLRDIDRYDLVRIELTSAYDLGIAAGN